MFVVLSEIFRGQRPEDFYLSVEKIIQYNIFINIS